MLKIMHQEHASSQPFIFNDEQLQVIEAVGGSEVPKIQTLKSRQVGMSTVFAFLDAVYMIINPGVNVGLVADEEVKAQALVGRVKDFLHQMGIKTPTAGRNYVVAENGSSIRAITANSQKGQENSRTGRSYSFQLLHLTELAFWPDQSAYGALEASAGHRAPIWNESTSSGPGDLFWHQWYGNNDFTKFFFPMEMHKAYRKDRPLTRIEEREADKLCIRDPQAAAFFFDKVESSFKGDLIAALREYPHTPEQAFLSQEGRWVRHNPRVVASQEWEGFNIFIAPEDCAGGVVFGVDTSEGKDQDASAIAILDRATGQLAATYKSALDEIDDLAESVKKAYIKYGEEDGVARVVVEDNAIGHATVQKLRKMGVPVLPIRTTTALKYTYMLNARREIEKHHIYAGQDLYDECVAAKYNDRGKFEGADDLLTATGMAIEELLKRPYVTHDSRNEGDKFDMSRYIGKRKSSWNTFS